MKNISLLLNLILIALLVYLGCNGKLSCKGLETPKPMAYCPPEGCETYKPGEKYGMISYNTARFLAENYAAGEGKKYIYDGSTNTGKLDARNIWFSMKILKNFIAFIESKACEAGCNEEKGLGIRIYYGKYPRKEDFHLFPDLVGVPDSFENHHTVFMMPTYHDPITKKEIDFDPYSLNKNCAFKPLDKNLPFFSDMFSLLQALSFSKPDMKQQRQPKVPKQDSSTYSVLGVKTMMLEYQSSDGTSEQQNHGTMAPPPDAEGSFPSVPVEN